jgi:hypothetical protein
VYPPFLGAGGGHTRWMERGLGGGVNILEDARHSSVLYICKYFVTRGLFLSQCPHHRLDRILVVHGMYALCSNHPHSPPPLIQFRFHPKFYLHVEKFPRQSNEGNKSCQAKNSTEFFFIKRATIYMGLWWQRLFNYS